jgi:hypothetical protein
LCCHAVDELIETPIHVSNLSTQVVIWPGWYDVGLGRLRDRRVGGLDDRRGGGLNQRRMTWNPMIGDGTWHPILVFR